MFDLPPALRGLADFAQFTLWKGVPKNDGTGKVDKFPCQHEGLVIDAHDPRYWMTAETALSWVRYHGGAYGLAFVLTDDDPFFFLDIDGCNEGGKWSALANVFLAALSGCAVEVSQSGNGLHILGRASLGEHSKKNVALGLELYSSKRFIALTGNGAIGDVNASLSPELSGWLVSQYFPARERHAVTDWDAGPCAEWSGPKNDDDLIRRASRAVSASGAFAGRATFHDLWTANEERLAASYPPSGNGVWDGSSADMALASHLAFWTGRDCARMERLMRQSALVREKWDDRPEYLADTILRACEGTKNVCQDMRYSAPLVASSSASMSVPVVHEAKPAHVKSVTHYTASAVDRSGSGFLSPEQQVEFFKGCVLITSESKIWTPHGRVMSKTQFQNTYAGYTFVLDRMNSKTTTDPWEAFVHNRAVQFPRVLDQCFRPDLPSGDIVETHGVHRVNTYLAAHVVTREGDAGPFLRHLEKLLPDAHDREILLAYLAALVQHKGFKFKWAPVIQGVEGNGKTLFSMVAEYCVGRAHTHWPKASKLGAQFNSWLYRKILYCVEDFGPSSKRNEVMEELKPMITGETLEIEGKGVDQESREVCGNFIFNTNHRGVIRKTKNDRRWCVFYTAQQFESDLERDGMDGAYMADLYSWLKGEDRYAELGENYGYSIVAHYLINYAIPPSLNPATLCTRAPRTSATDQAIDDARDLVEQIIYDAIEDEQIGLRGGFISAHYLRRVMEDANLKLSPQNRDRLMHQMGYAKHPCLGESGRTGRDVMPDGRSTLLFVKKNSDAWRVNDKAALLLMYEKAQKV